MKVWLLTHLLESESTKYVLAAGRRRGHEMLLIHPLAFHVLVSSLDGRANFLGIEGDAALPDCVFTRLGSSAPENSFYGLRQLEHLGITCINSPAALEQSRDKCRSFQVLARAGVAMPRTVCYVPGIPLETALAALPGPPWIVKLPISFQGRGVMLARDRGELERLLADQRESRGPLLLQEFIAESRASDIRVLVIGGRAQAAMRRQGQAGEFRSNLHCGGSASALDLTAELSRLAEAAAAAHGLPVAGIDILESTRGLLVVEVNGSPGLEGLQSVSPANLAENIIDYLEQSVA